MKYYLHEDGIVADKIAPLIEFIHSNEGALTIGINSMGGESAAARFLLYILNENKDRITLVATTGIFSAAFELFYRFEGTKKMCKNCRGMFHYASMEVRIAANMKPDGAYEKSHWGLLKEDRSENEAFAKTFMTSQEFNSMKQNNDIYFQFPRMKEIFSGVEIV